MSKSFSKLKDPKLKLTDQITFGKLKGCCVCDVIEDHYEYLIWAEKEGYIKFGKEVEILIAETAHFKAWAPPVEDQPKEIIYSPVFGFSDMEDDVPF